jgi:WD40 repeat protein
MKKRFEDRLTGFALPPQAPGESPGVSAIEPSPDGWKLTRRSLMGLLAVGAFVRPSKADGGAVCSSGAFAHEISLDSLSFLPGGQTLVSAGLDSFVKFWTIPDGALFRVANTDQVPLQVAASPDGNWIAVAMESGGLELWPTGGGSRRALPGHSDAVGGIAFSPDSGQLVSVSLDRTTKVWSVAEARLLQSFAGTADAMSWVAVPKGGYLVTAGGQVYLRSLSTGAILKTAPGKAFAVSPDGKLLAAHDGARVYMYAFPSLTPIVSVVEKRNATSLSFSDDGKLLAIAYTDAPARLYYAPGLTLKLEMEANEGPCLSASTASAGSPAARPAPVAAPRPANGYLAVASGKSIRLYTLPSGSRAPVCFMDIAASSPSVTGTEYILNGVVYTISCGARIPAGAECTCNCVPGNCPCVYDTGCSCVSDAGCDCVSDSGCSCDSDTGCGCVGDAGCSCDSDYGCGCVDDTGCGCDSDYGCGCDSDTGCGCDSDMGCGCVDD